MVGAWAEGRLPGLSPVRPADRHWWVRLHLNLRAYEEARHREYLGRVQAHHLCALGAAAAVADNDSLKLHWKSARDTLGDLLGGLFPWVRREQKRDTPSDGELRSQWETVFGKMDDPDTRRAIAETAAALARGRSRRQ